MAKRLADHVVYVGALVVLVALVERFLVGDSWRTAARVAAVVAMAAGVFQLVRDRSAEHWKDRPSHRTWKQSLAAGCACLAVLIACLVVARTGGPSWLWWVGTALTGACAALFEGARQRRAETRGAAR